MHRLQTFIAMGMLSLTLLGMPSAQAQSPPIAAPAQIIAAGVRGDTLTRTTVLRAITPISNIQASSTDLMSATGSAILAHAITVTVPADHLATGEILTVTMTIDLDVIPSSEYTGELLVSSDAGVLVLPVTVQVKHPWWLALPVLVLGVISGALLTAYHRHGRPYDDIMVRAGRLRTQMRSDPDLAATFSQHLERHLADGEAALQGADLDQAKQAIARAETIWQRWRRDRPNWIAQFAYSDELQQTIASAKMPQGTVYLRTITQTLHDVVRDAPAMPGPEAVAEHLHVQQQAIERFQKLYVEIRALMSASAGQTVWHQQAATYETDLFALHPTDERRIGILEQKIGTLKKEFVREESSQAEDTSGVLGSARGITNDLLRDLILMPVIPSLAPVATTENHARGAVRRLRWAGLISSLFILVLLALVGFGQIYGDNPTFGADVWTDYAALLAWGFGVEVSRASIMGLGRTD